MFKSGTIGFNRKYFIAAIFLFLIEAFIALFVTDAVIRPYGGDILVIFLLYCLLKSFSQISVSKAILPVFLFACLLEFFQYLKIVEFFSLEEDLLISSVLGNHFDWIDVLMYALGSLFLLIAEKIRASCS